MHRWYLAQEVANDAHLVVTHQRRHVPAAGNLYQLGARLHVHHRFGNGDWEEGGRPVAGSSQ
ncbi:MAG: hypothetical protein ABIQ72_15300 [Usitatibacter sp.]